MDYLKLYQILETYGIGGTAVALIVVILNGIIKSKSFGGMWVKITDKVVEFFLILKTKPVNVNESDIINHDIFNFIDYWMYSKIPTYQFSTEYRTVVFQKYLSIFLKSYKYELNDFIKSEKYKSMNQTELWKNLLNTLNNIIFKYEKECEESGIPKVIIDKMKQRNHDSIQLTIDLIESISTSPFYKGNNNYLIVHSVLNVMQSVLENMIDNSISACNSINGSLKGQTFIKDGKTYIEP